MAYISGIDYKLEVDVDLTGASPTFTEVDIISGDNNWGEVTDTFYKLDSYIAHNKVTALDPEFSFTIKVDSGDTATGFLLAKRYTNERTFDARITDPAQTSVLLFSAELTQISDPRTIEDVIAIDITLKIADGAITISV